MLGGAASQEVLLDRCSSDRRLVLGDETGTSRISSRSSEVH